VVLLRQLDDSSRPSAEVVARAAVPRVDWAPARLDPDAGYAIHSHPIVRAAGPSTHLADRNLEVIRRAHVDVLTSPGRDLLSRTAGADDTIVPTSRSSSMSCRSSAALGQHRSFFLGAPGTVALLIPWLLHWMATRRRSPAHSGYLAGSWSWSARRGLVHAFRSASCGNGLGTPAPIAPPDHLVVTGIYRYVRKPDVSGHPHHDRWTGPESWDEPCWSAMRWLRPFAMWDVRQVVYEEPNLRRRFGTEYDAYQATVPGWTTATAAAPSGP
jgi:hypothetical protein